MQFLYRAYGKENELLYIGITVSLKNRIRAHAHSSEWMQQTEWMKIEHYDDRESVLNAERIAIQTEKPRFNIQHKFRPNRSASPNKKVFTKVGRAEPNYELYELAKLRNESLKDVQEATEQLVKLVRAGAADGINQVQLAKRARVTRGTVRTWLGL